MSERFQSDENDGCHRPLARPVRSPSVRARIFSKSGEMNTASAFAEHEEARRASGGRAQAFLPVHAPMEHAERLRERTGRSKTPPLPLVTHPLNMPRTPCCCRMSAAQASGLLYLGLTKMFVLTMSTGEITVAVTSPATVLTAIRGNGATDQRRRNRVSKERRESTFAGRLDALEPHAVVTRHLTRLRDAFLRCPPIRGCVGRRASPRRRSRTAKRSARQLESAPGGAKK